MDVDVSELDRLAADLGSVGDNSGPFVRKAVEVAARNVKNDARDAVRGRKHFKGGASAIDYELKGFQGFGATVLDAEIGYDKGKPGGKLGNLIEFGAPRSNNSLPPGSELQTALKKNQGDFESGLEKAVDDALRRYGL